MTRRRRQPPRGRRRLGPLALVAGFLASLLLVAAPGTDMSTFAGQLGPSVVAEAQHVPEPATTSTIGALPAVHHAATPESNSAPAAVLPVASRLSDDGSLWTVVALDRTCMPDNPKTADGCRGPPAQRMH